VEKIAMWYLFITLASYAITPHLITLTGRAITPLPMHMPPAPVPATPVAATSPAPTLHVTVKTSVTYADNVRGVIEHRYRYGRDSLGREGFLDAQGQLYGGPDTFVARVTAALHDIEQGGPTGRSLIDYLEEAPDSTDIAYSMTDEADMQNGAYVFWNAGGGGMPRPAFIGLAHELAHISDIWHKTVNRELWRQIQNDQGQWVQVPYAELYATHIENKIRSENGLPLRVSYAMPGMEDGGEISSMILKPGTRESLYFDREEHTAYRRLKKSQPPMVY